MHCENVRVNQKDLASERGSMLVIFNNICLLHLKNHTKKDKQIKNKKNFSKHMLLSILLPLVLKSNHRFKVVTIKQCILI